MPTQIQWRRGTTAQTAVFTGALAEITVDTSKNTLVVHDGVTPGGHSLALETQFISANTTAQAAFDKANTAFTSANNLVPQIETVFQQANAAFDKANTNPLSPYFPTFPLGLVSENMYTVFGEHIDGIIYDMRLVPDGNLRIVDAGTI